MAGGFSLINPLLNKVASSEAFKPKGKSEAQLACEAKKGTWDPETLTCTPNKFALGGTGPENETPEQFKLRAQAEEQAATKTGGQFGVIKDEDTGRLSGFQRGRNTFLGIPPREVAELTTREAGLQELPIQGQAEGVLERRRQELQSTGTDLAVGGVNTVSEQRLAELKDSIEVRGVSYVNAALQALPDIIPDAIIGASTLASAFGTAALVAGQLGPQVALPEEVVTVPAAAALGVIVGSVSGALVGFFRSFVADVKRQTREQIEAPIRTLTETKGTLQGLISAQDADPQNAIEHKRLFDEQLSLIDIDYDRLKELTDSKLDKFLGDEGLSQLKEMKVFFAGERQQFIDEMNIALANPDPARIKVDSVTLAEIKKAIQKEFEKNNRA